MKIHEQTRNTAASAATMRASKTIFLFTPYTRRKEENLTRHYTRTLKTLRGHQQVVAPERADRVAVERMPRAIGDNRPDEAR